MLLALRLIYVLLPLVIHQPESLILKPFNLLLLSPLTYKLPPLIEKRLLKVYVSGSLEIFFHICIEAVDFKNVQRIEREKNYRALLASVCRVLRQAPLMLETSLELSLKTGMLALPQKLIPLKKYRFAPCL